MALTREQLARRLRDARASLGFTQAEVGAALRLHRPAVSEIEAGRRAVTSEELYELARLFAVPISELLGEPAPTAGQVERVLFRRDGIEQPRTRAAVKRFLERCRTERELEEMLGLEPPADERPGYGVQHPATVIQAVRQGERIAEQERRRLDVGIEPLRNPIDLLERQGVRIGPLEGVGAEDVDGIYFELEGVGSCVALNPERDSWTGFRSAFTATHEYAHWLLRDIFVEEFRFESATDDLREVRANAFAAAFLMPKDGLREYFEVASLVHDDHIPELRPRDIVLAMDHFGVSRNALLYRLQNLGLLSAELAKNLRDQDFSLKQLARTLGVKLRRERQIGTRLRPLTAEAWRRGLITTGRAADLLDLDVFAFRRLMAALGEEQEIGDDLPLVGAAAEE